MSMISVAQAIRLCDLAAHSREAHIALDKYRARLKEENLDRLKRTKNPQKGLTP